MNISGGVYGLMTLGVHYCGGSLAAAWTKDMAAVADLDEWSEVSERNPRNRQLFLDQDRWQFIATMERWMAAYCPNDDELVPGLAEPMTRARSTYRRWCSAAAQSDANHTRATSERVAELLPNAELIEPPWGDTEWIERMADGPANLFHRLARTRPATRQLGERHPGLAAGASQPCVEGRDVAAQAADLLTQPSRLSAQLTAEIVDPRAELDAKSVCPGDCREQCAREDPDRRKDQPVGRPGDRGHVVDGATPSRFGLAREGSRRTVTTLAIRSDAIARTSHRLWTSEPATRLWTGFLGVQTWRDRSHWGVLW